MKEFAPNLRVVTAAAVFLDAVFILISALCLEQVDGKILLGLLLGDDICGLKPPCAGVHS